MTDIFSPSQTPDVSNVPSITPGETPLLTNLPSATTALNRKYADPQLQQLLSQADPTTRNVLMRYDQSRVAKGQQPLSAQQTLLALQTIKTKQPATPPEDQSFFSRAVSDVGNIVSEIPHLPFTLYNEATQLPEAPGKLSEVLGRGDIQSIVGGLQEVPGLRLVPGVYTASTLANQGPAGLLQHPVFTALDVLPYAKPATGALTESLFSKLPRVQEARAALDLPAENAARTAAGLQPINDPSALRLAARTSPTLQAIRATRPAQSIAASFGTVARDLSQMYQSTVGRILAQSNPDAPTAYLTEETLPMREALSAAREWSNSIDPQRMQELTHRIELDRNSTLADPTLTDTERAFVQSQADHTDAMAAFALQRNWMKQIDGELFTPEQGSRILNSRRQVAKFTAFNDARNLVTQPDITKIDPAAVLSEHLTKPEQIKLGRLYAHAIDAAGYDASPLFNTLTRAEKFNDPTTILNAHAALKDILANPVERPIIPPEQMLADLRPYVGKLGSPGDPTLAQARAFIRSGNYQQAVEKLRMVADRSTHVIPGVEDMVDSLRRIRDQNTYLDRTAQFNDRAVAQLTRTNQALENRLVPARFVPLIEQGVKDRVLDMFSNDPQATALIHDGFYSLVPALDPSELNRIQAEVTSTWKDLRDQGFDPAFVHRVSPGRVQSLTRPNISDAVRTPTQVRTRTLDATPYVKDAAVALTDQAMEYLSRLGQEAFTDNVLNLHGVSRLELEQRYYQRGVDAAARDPQYSARAHAEQLIQRDWEKYDPQSIFPETKAKLSTFQNNDLYIPKTVSDTLRKLFQDRNYKLASVFDPVMKVFRTSILPLSPRWHVGNIAGGAVLLSMSTDPSIFFRYLRDAINLTKSGDLHLIEGMPPAGFGSVPADIIKWNESASLADKAVAAYHYKGGGFIRKLWEQSAPARDKFSSLIDNSYKFNGFIDDMYRAMAYLYGQDKALTKGMTAAEAEQAGVALVRKILPEWDRITPFERQVMRFVFPFYTWGQFILRHAYKYPIDHPYRAAVTSSLARQELQDFGGALPYRFMDSIFLGHPDANGNVSALQTSSLNPFRDVANYFSLAGFTRSANPIISSVLESMGINPAQGTQDLYPDISYDPETGQLRPSNPSFLTSFIGNVLPQSQIITAMLGHSDQFKQLLRTNPDAAASMIRSSVGLPNLFRTVNPQTEETKAEVQRETLQSQVKNDALRTGDWSRAQQFPQLRAYFQQLAVLMRQNPQAFAPYVPQPGQSTADAVRSGLVGMNVP